MSGGRHRSRLTVKAVAAAKPAAIEYTLWDRWLVHFGVRQPSGVRSWTAQTCVTGRRRKIILRRFPERSLDAARREGAAVRARLWGGEDVTPPRKEKAPLFQDFAARYRSRRKHRWKSSSLKTFDISLKNRLMPHFGRLRCDAIDHARGSAWFDAASTDRPGAANRTFDILCAMLWTVRQWGDLGEQVPDACANIVKNPGKPGALPQPRRAGASRCSARPAPERAPLAGGRDPAVDPDRSAALRSHQSQVGRDRRADRRQRERAARSLQDRPAHHLARTRSGKAGRGAAAAGWPGAGISRDPHIGSALHLLGRHTG